ncbi:hypothetical protein F4680DRAFT_403626 [Xylaria scruposa]|nr:hypothetical protein F4680DRAFT_403626 [Xylaria scruposa]
MWMYSPWFHLTGRREIETFAEAFADRDEVGCAIIAQKMADRVGWRRDLATFNQYIPQFGGDCHPDWVFHCIGTQAHHNILPMHIPLGHLQKHWKPKTEPRREE